MNSYSQAGQDRFVYEILNHKPDGTFLDIGCHDGRKHSNSLALEEVGWRGLLVDIQTFPGLAGRASDFIVCDAVTADWKRIFELYFPGKTEIDYLSLDVDDATTQTLWHLLALPMRYRVITCEHDAYRLGPAQAVAQGNLLASAGYELICKYVCVGHGEWGSGGPFEDWYIAPELNTEENRRRFLCANQLGSSIVPDES